MDYWLVSKLPYHGWYDEYIHIKKKLGPWNTLTLHASGISSYRKQLGEGSTPSLESWVPHKIWSWNIQQRYSLTKDVDWWHYHFGQLTYVYFTHQKQFLLMSSKIEKWKMTRNQLLLTREITGESFKLIWPLVQ